MTEKGNQRSIVVVGAGGHAKVIIDCLILAGWLVIGCTDADPTPRECAGVPVLGTDEMLKQLLSDGIATAFCALGDNRLRQRVGAQLVAMGFHVPTILGPGAILSPLSRIGAGVAMLPGAVVNVGSVVGDFAIINTNSNIDHDCTIGRAAHIGPGASIAGEVKVGERAFLATGSSVIPRTNIGADSIIGAGSVVIRDLPPGVVAYGNPAKVRRRIQEGAS